MSKYAAWAEDDDGPQIDLQLVREPLHRPPPPPPPIVGGYTFAPAAMQTIVPVAAWGAGPTRYAAPSADPMPPSCTLVKPDMTGRDPWRDAMARLPDLAKQSGVDYSNGVDAVRDFALQPEGAVARDWSPNTRYSNGVTDSTAKGHVAQVLASHGASYADIRSSSFMPRGVGPNG